jgi:hypothetical protein
MQAELGMGTRLPEKLHARETINRPSSLTLTDLPSVTR